MNNNTRLRVRVPKALYESIQAELSKKKIKEEETPPATAGDASSKSQPETSSAIDDKFMTSLATAKKLINSKITNQKDYANFVLKFAEEILNNEQFADTTKGNANYINFMKYLGLLAGNPQSSRTSVTEEKSQPYYKIAADAINFALDKGKSPQEKSDILVTLKDAVEKKFASMQSSRTSVG